VKGISPDGAGTSRVVLLGEGGTSASKCNGWAVPRGNDGVFTSLPCSAVWFSGSQNLPPVACSILGLPGIERPKGRLGRISTE
jgi:hypothetical protein